MSAEQGKASNTALRHMSRFICLKSWAQMQRSA